jgi:peptidoglycan/LPS O-acetylase OafA/YrhL
MQSPLSPLARPYSLYLDLVRLLAAAMVVLTHFGQQGVIAPGSWGILESMGREAVIVFFVLSGYVIAASTAQRRTSSRDYAVARLSRVYSVALPVLLLGLACALLLRPVLGAFLGDYALDKLYLYIPLHLMFLGQHWTLTEVPPLMEPYWSLNYEVWYYLLFGLACYLRGTRRIVWIAVALAVMGYKLWLLLPVWLSGVWLYHACPRDGQPLLAPGAARAGWLVSLVLFGLYVGLDAETPLRMLGRDWWPFASFPLGSADRFLADYLSCAIVLTNFACARDARFNALLRVAPVVRILASHTFTLYLSHSIVIAAWLALYPHDQSSSADVLALVAAIAASTAVLGSVTERRSHLVRAGFGKLLCRLFGPPPAAAPASPPACRPVAADKTGA